MQTQEKRKKQDKKFNPKVQSINPINNPIQESTKENILQKSNPTEKKIFKAKVKFRKVFKNPTGRHNL